MEISKKVVDSLLAGDVISLDLPDGRSIETSIGDTSLIKEFIEMHVAKMLKEERRVNTPTHVSQLAGVRGVPGAVGAAGGLASGIAWFFRNEIPPDLWESGFKALESIVVGGIVTEIGYRLAGVLGKRKERELSQEMTQRVIDEGIRRALKELPEYLEGLIQHRVVN